MIAIGNALMTFAIVSALCAVASAVLMTAALQKRGIPVNWVWLQLRILSRYLNQYRDVTRQETGRTGPLFYIFVVAINLTLLTALVGLILRAL